METKQTKIEEPKFTDKQEIEYLQRICSIDNYYNDKLLKSLIYLEWYAEQQEKRAKQSLKKFGIKETKEEKSRREQMEIDYRCVKNMIHKEMSKYFQGMNSSAFEQETLKQSITSANNGFGNSIFYE